MHTGATVKATSHTGASGGTPFRRIYDQMSAAGLPLGGGSDATNVGPLNPWLMMSLMSTGINNAGVAINAAQPVTRMEALKMCTKGSAYVATRPRPVTGRPSVAPDCRTGSFRVRGA